MKTLKYRSNGPDVVFLEKTLAALGYEIIVSEYFAKDTHHAVLDFQSKNGLKADGVVGPKTWAKLLPEKKTVRSDKSLTEQEMTAFAAAYGLELAVVKAVCQVESSGEGFLPDGRPRILFEGHEFWRQLKKRGFDPNDFSGEETEDILYERWTKKYYKGGAGEYERLEKAAALKNIPSIAEAAYASASYGAFQIMGHHFASLGHESVSQFVEQMNANEGAHLEAFGRFCKKNNLLKHLQAKDWAAFAKGYNGPGYKQNKYDIKLREAYERNK